MVSFIVITTFIAIIVIGIPAFLSRHSHEWEIISKIPKEEIIRDGDDGHVLCTNKSMVYIQRCKVCGELKHYIVK